MKKSRLFLLVLAICAVFLSFGQTKQCSFGVSEGNDLPTIGIEEMRCLARHAPTDYTYFGLYGNLTNEDIAYEYAYAQKRGITYYAIITCSESNQLNTNYIRSEVCDVDTDIAVFMLSDSLNNPNAPKWHRDKDNQLCERLAEGNLPPLEKNEWYTGGVIMNKQGNLVYMTNTGITETKEAIKERKQMAKSYKDEEKNRFKRLAKAYVTQMGEDIDKVLEANARKVGQEVSACGKKCEGTEVQKLIDAYKRPVLTGVDVEVVQTIVREAGKDYTMVCMLPYDYLTYNAFSSQLLPRYYEMSKDLGTEFCVVLEPRETATIAVNWLRTLVRETDDEIATYIISDKLYDPELRGRKTPFALYGILKNDAKERNKYVRFMEELGVSTSKKGKDPARILLFNKNGELVYSSDADAFKGIKPKKKFIAENGMLGFSVDWQNEKEKIDGCISQIREAAQNSISDGK